MPNTDEGFVEVEDTVSWLANELFQAGTVEETLQRVVDLAARAVVSCDGAGLMVILEDGPSTAAASSELVRKFDRAQIVAGGGPCVDAAVSGTANYAFDLSDDDRWPQLAAASVRIGVRSVFGLALATARPSALNLYAELPYAFGSVDRAQAVLLGTLARHAIEVAEERAAESDRTLNLTAALRSRELIGQAQGILMERERITAEQAFETLRRASQHLNIKLRDVAQRLVDTGEKPEP